MARRAGGRTQSPGGEQPASVTLPLSLNSHRNFQAFFKAIEDPTVQDHLVQESAVDKGIHEVVLLARDHEFLAKAESLVNLLQKHRNAFQTWQGSFEAQSALRADATPEQVAAASNDINSYVREKYPDGVKLLSEYGRLAQRASLAADSVQTWTNAVAFAEALANGVVYANVAVATSVVVAAAAAAVIAAAVMVP